LLHRLGVGLDVEAVLGNLSGDAGHVRGLDGGEMGGYDPPLCQQRQIWFWLDLIGTIVKDQVFRVHTSIILIFA
jgi:hypothetical protein